MAPRAALEIAAAMLAASLAAGCGGCAETPSSDLHDAALSDADVPDAAEPEPGDDASVVPPDVDCEPGRAAEGEACVQPDECDTASCVPGGGGSVCGPPDECSVCGQSCEVDDDCCHHFHGCGPQFGCYDGYCQSGPILPC